MKKVLSITLISALAIVLSTGCGGETPAPAASTAEVTAPANHDAKVSAQALYVNTHDNEKIAHAIEKAGEKAGWKITEFKSNEVVAEKINGEDTISTSIKFSEGHIEFGDNSITSDLREAIIKELSNTSAH